MQVESRKVIVIWKSSSLQVDWIERSNFKVKLWNSTSWRQTIIQLEISESVQLEDWVAWKRKEQFSGGAK